MKEAYFFVITMIFISCTPIQLEQDTEIKYQAGTLSDVDAIAWALKEKIINSKTEIMTTGNACYVSNKGNGMIQITGNHRKLYGQHLQK